MPETHKSSRTSRLAGALLATISGAVALSLGLYLSPTTSSRPAAASRIDPPLSGLSHDDNQPMPVVIKPPAPSQSMSAWIAGWLKDNPQMAEAIRNPYAVFMFPCGPLKNGGYVFVPGGAPDYTLVYDDKAGSVFSNLVDGKSYADFLAAHYRKNTDMPTVEDVLVELPVNLNTLKVQMEATTSTPPNATVPAIRQRLDQLNAGRMTLVLLPTSIGLVPIVPKTRVKPHPPQPAGSASIA